MNESRSVKAFDREHRASVALDAYSEAASGDPIFYDDVSIVISDLLTDLMHYCSEYKIDANNLWANSRMTFEIEAGDE